MTPLSPIESWGFLIGVWIVCICLGLGLNMILNSLARMFDDLFKEGDDVTPNSSHR